MRMVAPVLISLWGLGCLPSLAAPPPAPISAPVPAVADGEKTSTPEPAPLSANPSEPAANPAPPAANDSTKPPPPAASNATASSLQAAASLQDKKLRASGYKPETHGTTTVYCRKEAVLGSRFENKICRSADELEHTAQVGKDMVQDMQRVGNAGPKSN